jgi:hypothetical protein
MHTSVKKITSVILTSLAIIAPLFSITPVSAAAFDPNKLIDDAVFSDTRTFGSAAGIQQFLQSKNSLLADTSPEFLQKLREPQDTALKTNLNDPQPNLGRLRTAAELIWDSAQKTGINPQVVLVTLQKEQGLITNRPTNLQRALDRSMGFACPDSAACDDSFAGFYSQLFGYYDNEGNRYLGAPGSLMRSFSTPGGRGPMVDAQNQVFGSPKVRTAKVGDTIVIDNTQGPPNNAPATQVVTLTNSATAALYRYTPHVYNGNYNFWKFFNEWFRYPNGTLLKLSNSSTIYIINNGLRSMVPNFVLQARGLNPAAAITVSDIEMNSYQEGPMYTPADNTIIKLTSDPSKLFVFENNIKHPVSSFVLQQRGLNAANAISVSDSEANLFQTGSLLVPKEGSLIKGSQSPTVYLIKDSKRMILSAYTFKQYGYSFASVITIPQEEVDQYELGKFLLPKDGTLVKYPDSLTVYILKDQILRPMTLTVFKLHGYSFKNIATLNRGELEGATQGRFWFPPDNTYFRVPQIGVYYLYSKDSKRHISPFVFKQRAVASLSVDIGPGEAHDMKDGSPLPPKEGTLIKGDQSDAIYVIVKEQKSILDYSTWVNKYGKKAPNILPQAEVDAYTTAGSQE